MSDNSEISQPAILVNGIKINSKCKTLEKIEKLRSSVEEKRQMLNKIYSENSSDNQLEKTMTSAVRPKQSMLAPTSVTTNILKHVHFESDDEEEDRQRIKNSTYTIRSETFKKTTKENQIQNKNSNSPDKKTQLALKNLKSPLKVNTKVSNNNNKNISKTAIVSKPFLTVQQKRELELAQKAEFRKAVEILHIKVLTRKYAYLWLRRFFYPDNKIKDSNTMLLLPSQVDKYHLNRTLGIILSKWHNETCWVRNEWRLTVKAQCHHNYVILNKLWKYWKIYSEESRAENFQKTKADNYHEFNLKKTVFKEWRVSTLSTIRNRIKFLEVQKQRNLEFLGDCFNVWKKQLATKRNIEKMAEKAYSHFKLIQLNKCYTIWQYKFTTGKDERNSNRVAEKHYRTVLLEKCLNSLRYYSIYRRKKRVQKKKLVEYAESQLVYRFYHMWLDKFEMKKRDLEIAVKIKEFKERYLAARLIEYWRNAYKTRLDLKDRECRMKKFYQKKLKRKAFDLVKKNWMNAEEERKRVRMAEKFSRFWFKKRFFDMWIDKLEERNEMKSIHLVFKARVHHEQMIVKDAFNVWRQYYKSAVLQRLKEYKADELHKNRLRKLYFKAIQTYVFMTKTKRKDYETAVTVCNANTYHNYYFKWVEVYERTIELQINTRIAILHNESKTKDNIFKNWYLKFKTKLAEECLENRARNFHKKNLVRKMLAQWKEIIYESHKELLNESKASVFDKRRICLPVFESWKKFVLDSKAYKAKLENTDLYYQKKMLRKILAVWKTRTSEFKEINFQVECKFQKKQREKSLEILNRMQLHASESRQDKHYEDLAATFYLKNLMLRIISEWKSYSSRKITKRTNQTEQIEAFKSLKKKLVIRSFYSKWTRRTDEALKDAKRSKLAVEFSHRNQRKKVLHAWKIFIKNCRYRRLLDNQANLFLELRLKTEFYYRWCNVYERELSLKDKNRRALIFWSLTVQQKYLAAWIKWFQFKKEKKKRYKDAFDRRQLDILKECGRNFIVYATDSRIRRLDALRHLKENNLLEHMDLQAKYFNIWIQKCDFIKKKKIFLPKSIISEAMPVLENKHLEPMSSNSLEKQKSTTGVITEVVSKSRPTPRKPSFLDSVDLTNSNSDEYPMSLEINCTPSDIEKIENYKPIEIQVECIMPRQVQIKPQNICLLPPSAFSSITTIEQHTHSIQSISSSGHKKNMNEIRKLVSPDKPAKKKKQDDLELVELKKKLESLEFKSEKLKRLKEQEQMLNKCIESSENNKALSFCGTIYEEKDQVVLEINELTKLIKREKQEVTELAKKYKL